MRTFKFILGALFILRALGGIAGLLHVFLWSGGDVPPAKDAQLFGAIAGACIFIALGAWLMMSAWQKR